MIEMNKKAYQEGVSWRALQELARRRQVLEGMPEAVGNVLFTPEQQRTPEQQALLEIARDATAPDLARRARIRSRQEGVNQLSGRTRGQYVEGGQPRRNGTPLPRRGIR